MTGRSRNNSSANLSEIKIKAILLILQEIVNTLNKYLLTASRKIMFKNPLKIAKLPMLFEDTPTNGCSWEMLTLRL